jgi:hypothetical protein
VLSHLSLVSACPKILVFLGGDDVYNISMYLFHVFSGLSPSSSSSSRKWKEN